MKSILFAMSGGSVKDGDQVNATNLSALRQELAGNVRDLALVRTDLARLKEKLPSIPNWLTVTGTVCGILAAIVSVGIGLHTYFWRVPQLNVVAGPTLALRYLPQQHRLGVEWTFSVGNDGDLANIVSDEASEIDDFSSASNQVIVFSPTDLDCTTGQAKVSFPFVVGQGLPVPVTCTANGYLSDQGRSILADGAAKKFVFSLKGRKQTESNLQYCFDLPDKEIGELRSGERTVAIRFVYSSCDAGVK
jgi:hypothetical protein